MILYASIKLKCTPVLKTEKVTSVKKKKINACNFYVRKVLEYGIWRPKLILI